MQPNPFEYGNPITDAAKFFGRQGEINQIRDRLYHMASTSVVGERRIGKTSLLKIFTVAEMVARLGFDESFVFCYIDWQGFDQIEPERFWQIVLSEFRLLLEELGERRKDSPGVVCLVQCQKGKGAFREGHWRSVFTLQTKSPDPSQSQHDSPNQWQVSSVFPSVRGMDPR